MNIWFPILKVKYFLNLDKTICKKWKTNFSVFPDKLGSLVISWCQLSVKSQCWLSSQVSATALWSNFTTDNLIVDHHTIKQIDLLFWNLFVILKWSFWIYQCWMITFFSEHSRTGRNSSCNSCLHAYGWQHLEQMCDIVFSFFSRTPV